MSEGLRRRLGGGRPVNEAHEKGGTYGVKVRDRFVGKSGRETMVLTVTAVMGPGADGEMRAYVRRDFPRNPGHQTRGVAILCRRLVSSAYRRLDG
jgi:hypothetical protein